MNASNLPESRYEIFIPERIMVTLEAAAQKYRTSISMILREILSNPDNKPIPKNLKRPRKFEESVHRFPVLMYGDDKSLWKIRLTAHSCEFGSYLRFLIDLYQDKIDIIAKYGTLVAECKNFKKKFIPFLNRYRNGYQLLVSFQNVKADDKISEIPENQRRLKYRNHIF